MTLHIRGLAVELGGRPVVDGADLDVGDGELLGLVGPNGSGKSTVLRSVYRAVRPGGGAVHIDDADIGDLRQRELARRVAVVAQENPIDVDFRCRQLVLMGRSPHRGALEAESAADRALAADALDRVGASHLAQRRVTTLSGGEKQRVLLARALTQQAPVLLLDEPTNHLDVRAGLDLLDLVRDLGLTTLCVLHDLNLAAAYCDRIAVLADGRVRTSGTPTEVLTPQLVREVFDVGVDVLAHPATGRPLLAWSTGDSGGTDAARGEGPPGARSQGLTSGRPPAGRNPPAHPAVDAR